MKHTLRQLRSGELAGIKRLSLSEKLTHFPLEILSLSESLEILDLSHNQLSSLPNEITQLTRLRIIFASENKFETFPEILGQCSNLEMIGFKSNQIKSVPDHAFPPKLRWLILTNNRIEFLPDTLGQCIHLQKLALAGNQLSSIPQTLSNCVNLELIRISANNLKVCPEHLLSLPKLAWIGFSGNPFCQISSELTSNFGEVAEVKQGQFSLQEKLGQGASGVIYKAKWVENEIAFPNDIAVKVFKGEITSDGYPQDELNACLKVGRHVNLVQSIAQVNETGYLALVMNLIPPNYKNLGLPPTLESCTRDTFEENFSLPMATTQKIIQQMKAVFEHMHQNKVCHGDLYAHNTLFDEDANIIFGDFGAASLYHMLTDQQQAKIKEIEHRALNYFIEDLMSVTELVQAE